jgi:RHS repeat-associated protein
MRRGSFLTVLFLLSLGTCELSAQAPAPGPDVDPEGDTGALKAHVGTGCGYDPHSGNATRSVTDLRYAGAPGVYGLDFTRYWNSLLNDSDNPNAVEPMDFGNSGWSHSWAWSANYYGESDQPGGDGTEEIFTSSITITFPDGHANKYKITRSNRAHGIPPNVAPPDPRLGPPYTVPETNWPPPGDGVHDHLNAMASDGSNFWLYTADGGAIHFVGMSPPDMSQGYAWWRYQATEVIDPHGLITTLHYDGLGRLDQVLQPSGRSLTIQWGDQCDATHCWGNSVIGRVETVGTAATTAIRYNYTWAASPQGGSALVLASVTYPDEPTVGQTTSASYTYGYLYGDDGTSAVSPTPLLKVADDPHFAGAMRHIRYSYVGGGCRIQDQPAPGFEPYLNAHLDYYLAQPNTILSEESGCTGKSVSSFALYCFAGTRMETKGSGGWRMFYYGRSAGQQGNLACLGYQLAKVTDFSVDNPFPASLPFERQNYAHGQPWQVWDGRGILTELVGTPFNPSTGQMGDDSGLPSEIHHADGSVHLYDRINPGNSAAQDYNSIPNTYNRWVFKHTDERGQITTYTRDSLRRLTRINYPDGSFETFENYNAFNQFLTHRLPSDSPNQPAIEYLEYDARGLLQQEWDTVDGQAAAKVYTYDDHDRIATVSDGLSRQKGAPYSTMMKYNGWNQVTEVHYAPTGISGDPYVRYEYDIHGDCVHIYDEMGHRSDYAYDEYRRCTSYTEQLNAPNWQGNGNVPDRTWTWIYDRYIDRVGLTDASANTSKVWRIQIEPGFNAGGDRKMTARWFDLQDHVALEQTGWVLPGGAALGNWVWTADGETHYFTYDANGNKSTYTDPRSRVTSYTYDNRNRLWQTIEPLNRITANSYDTTSNKTLVTFPDTTTQQWLDYDAFGQAGRFIDERGNTTNLTYFWGPMKKLRTVTTHRDRDGGGTEDQLTVFTNDGMGRLLQTFFPDGSHEDGTYEFGQLKTWQTRKGQIKIVNYDARGRESSHSWSDATPGVTRRWDDASRMTSIANIFSTIDFGYDSAGQILWEGDTIAGSDGAGGNARVQMTFNRYPDGQVAHFTFPYGFTIRKDYSARGQLNTVGWDDGNGAWQAQLINYHYYPDGKVDHQDYCNGTTSVFSYDGRGMISSVQHKRSSSGPTLASHAYTRDTRDRITWFLKGSDASLNPMENGLGDIFYYDAEGQLTDSVHEAANYGGNPAGGQRWEHFNYDALGNRKGSNIIGLRGWLNFSRRDNGLNQYSSWSPSVINYDDQFYGAAGNGVLMQEGWITASYNALNQPIAIWSPNMPSGCFTWFGYDPLGRCVKRWVGPSGGANSDPATYMYYDDWNMVQEGGVAWGPSRLYAMGNRVDEIAATFNAATGQFGYHHYDARGHCTLLSDGGGGIMEQYAYDAFGLAYTYDAGGNNIGYSPFGNRFLFTGREWLSDLRIYDFRNRHYLPELGRFLQPDPKEFGAGDYNLYRYCHNDPINKSDPDGLVDLSYTPADDTAHVWENSFNPSDRFTVAGHANSEGIVVNNKLLSPERVAKDMIAKGYTPEKPVLVVACETGKGPDSFASKLAQTLAKLTGAESKVQAPTTKIASGSTKGAEPTVQANEKTGKPGELKTFTGTLLQKKLKKDE